MGHSLTIAQTTLPGRLRLANTDVDFSQQNSSSDDQEDGLVGMCHADSAADYGLVAAAGRTVRFDPTMPRRGFRQTAVEHTNVMLCIVKTHEKHWQSSGTQCRNLCATGYASALDILVAVACVCSRSKSVLWWIACWGAITTAICSPPRPKQAANITFNC